MKYSLRPREMPRAKAEGFPDGSGYISSFFLTRVTIQTFSITNPIPARSKLEELILRIAPTAGQYGEKLPSRFSKMGELNFNIIMFSKGQKKGRLIA